MFGKCCYRIDESLLGVSCPVSWIHLYPNKQGGTHITPYGSEFHSPLLLPGKSYGWRSLVGYRPWGRKESDSTEWLHFPHNTLCTLSVPNNMELQEGRRKWSNPLYLSLSPLCLKDTLLVPRASQKSLGVWVPAAACGCLRLLWTPPRAPTRGGTQLSACLCALLLHPSPFIPTGLSSWSLSPAHQTQSHSSSN